MKDNKDISEKGYKDGSPYKDRPYLDIHTPTGIIDMTNVSVPLLANNVVLHPNSGMHKFDTTMVREIPLAQDGDETKADSLVDPTLQVEISEENQAVYDDVYNVMLNYLNSDGYLERLKKQGYENPEETRDARIKGLERTTVSDKRGMYSLNVWDMYLSIPACANGDDVDLENLPEDCKEEVKKWRERFNNSGSYTRPMLGDIEMDMNQVESNKWDVGPVYAHELGHNIGGWYTNEGMVEDDPLGLKRELNFQDDYILNTLNKLWQLAPWDEVWEGDKRETDFDWQDNPDGTRRGEKIGDRQYNTGYFYPNEITQIYDYETIDRQVLWDDEKGYYLPDELYKMDSRVENVFSKKIPYDGTINPLWNSYLEARTKQRRLKEKYESEGVNYREQQDWKDSVKVANDLSNKMYNMEIPGSSDTLPNVKKGLVHSIGSTESYADLTGLRYYATTVIPGWTPDQEMTPEIWNKLVKQYKLEKEEGKNNLIMDRMIKRYGKDGENIINIMNTVADANDEIGGDDIQQTMFAKYGGSVKQSPYDKEKLALKNQDGIIADMMRNGAFLPQFKMGAEKKIETPTGNYTIKKDFDKGRDLPFINYKYKDVDDRVYYDKDDQNDTGDFQIIDVAQQMHDQKRAHERTKALIKKYKAGEKLSYTAMKHLASLGIIPNKKVKDPKIEALTKPPVQKEEITFEDINVSKNIKNVKMDDGNVIPIQDQIALYLAYVSGAADGTAYEKKLKRIYDKLNRVYYKDAKKAGLETIEYMKSLTES